MTRKGRVISRVRTTDKYHMVLPLGFGPVPVPQLLRNSELVPSRSLRESGVPRNSRNRPAAGIRYFQRYSYTNIMYIIAFLRNTVRTIVHRLYVDRTCTFYVVPRYLRNRGLGSGTTVPHISRKSRPASSAAGPNPRFHPYAIHLHLSPSMHAANANTPAAPSPISKSTADSR